MKRFAFIFLIFIFTINFSIYSQSVTTSSATSITANSAILNGSYVTGGPDYIAGQFFYGTSRSNLNQTASADPSFANSNTAATGAISGLTENTMYYFAFKADDFPPGSYNTYSGDTLSFTTLKAEPSSQGTNINFSAIASTTLTSSWTRGDGDGILIVAKEGAAVSDFPSDGNTYTANAAFGSGSQIGTGNYVLYDGTGTSVDVTSLTAGTEYHFRVFEYNNSGSNIDYLTSSSTGNPNSTTTIITEPTTQAHTITFASVQTTSLTINWTNGNGSSRIVAVRETDQGTITNPSDNSTYSASTDWSAKGDQLGTSGYYVVYNGSGSSVALTNLTANTAYWVQVFEYNGSTGSENYYTATATDNPNNTTTLKLEPSVQASSIGFSAIATTTFTTSWTRGNGDGVIILAKSGSAVTDFPVDGTTYTADAAFGSGSQIGSDNYVLYIGSGTSVDATALSAGTDYHIRAFEYTNSGADIDYYTASATNNPNNQSTLQSEPSTQASDIVFTDVQTTQISLSWTSGDGTNRIVLVKQGSAVDADPVDATSYTPNTIYASGDQIGTGNYVVYSDAGTSVTVTGLTAGTDYYFKVYEYNNGGPNYNYKTDGFPSGNNPNNTTTLKLEPTVQASSISFSSIATTTFTTSWSRGNGDGVIVVGKSGSAVSDFPVDGTTYTANAAFGSGDEIGVGTGVYVLYIGTGTSVDITALTSGTDYHIRAFEYNNSGSNIDYLTSSATDNPNNQTTLEAEPSTQASDIVFSNLQTAQVTLTWTSGNGANRIVLAKQAALVDSDPVDATGYSANAAFGSGDQIGTGNYVVYNGSSNTVTVTGLSEGTQYAFKVYEYSNSGASSNYKTDGFPNGTNPNDTTTIKSQPSIQAQDITFSNYNTTSYTINWTRGNGDSLLIVGKQESTVTEFPVDGTEYTANTVFGSGTDLGSSNYVVYNGPATNATITGLTAGTEYYFRAFEYNNTGSSINYLTTSATGNPNNDFTLDTEPSTQASNIVFSDVGSDTINIQWTNGNGNGRLILARQGGPISSNPVDASTYTANDTFSSGDQIGSGNYVVYNGTGNNFTVRGLLGTTTYYFKVYEYNNTGTINYNIADNTNNPNSQTTSIASAPTTQASLITFSTIATTSFSINWTNGNGASRIVAMKQGSGAIENPSDNTTYSANTTFGSGDQLGSSGYYIVYNGSGSTVNVTNLTANTEYYVQIFEYNNTAGNEAYQTSTATDNPNSSFTLKLAPTTQASSILFSNWKTNSMDVSWTNGDGDNRICVINTVNSFSNPTDGTDPTANSVYGGSGEQTVYNSSGNSLTVTGLTQSTTYYFRVFEYNNTGSNTLYYTATATNNPNSSTTLGPATWIGGDPGNETDWGTDANWNIASVPTGDYSTTIPASASPNMPDITGNRTVDYLTVEAGAYVNISDGGSLTVNNNVDLEASSDATPSGMIVIPGTGTLSVTGTSTMNRYTPTTTDWHLVSVPVSSPSITDFTGYYVNSYDEATAGWNNLNSGSSISIMQGVSTYYSSSQTLSFDGTFNTGSQSISVTNASPGDDAYGWNLVGNPYPSAIDWEASSGWTLTNVDPTAYYYNASSGTYSTYNRSTSTGTGDGTRYIATCQGFFIHASNNGTLGTTNAVRTSNSQSFRKDADKNKQMVRILAEKNGLSSDLAIIFFPGATDGVDSEFDAYKLLSSNDEVPDIYTKPNDFTKLTMDTYNSERLQNLSEDGFNVKLGIAPGSAGVISLSASEIENIPNNIYVYLHDKSFNDYIDLKKYSHEIYLTGTSEDRLSVFFSPIPLTINQEKLIPDLLIYTEEKSIFVKTNLFETNNSLIKTYDISGRLVGMQQTGNTSLQKISVNQSGTYILKIIIDKSIVTQKVVVR